MSPPEPALEPATREIIDRILAAAEPYDFRTFVVGFARPAGYSREEHEARFRALKVAVGEELLRLWPGRDVEFERPDARFNVLTGLSIEVVPAPLFIAGRYRKLSRYIPSTRWIHHRCGGRGCAECEGTGTLCGPSVQEILEAPVLELTRGRATLFHGMGREDTDVRMLGSGRPFVLEVFHPFQRRIDLAAVSAAAAVRGDGLAEILGLAFARREDMEAVKSTPAEKTYRALVNTSGDPPADAAARAAALGGVSIRQLSPLRVAARRGADKERIRRVVESRWLGPFEGGHLWEVRVEAGTYMKELISGEEGRTRPSLAGALGVPCRCAALDVLEVHWDPPWEAPPGPADP